MDQKSKVDSDEILRGKMRRYVHGIFMGDYGAVASVFETNHGKKVSIRTIQSWLIGSNCKSSRKCPEWAVNAISDFINNNPNYFETLHEYNKILNSDNILKKQRLLDQREVDFAEYSIRVDEVIKKKWEKASIGELSKLIYDLESRIDEYIQHHHMQLHVITSSLSRAESFEEFKSDCLQSLRDERFKNYAVRKTAKDILEKNEEFSDDYGLLNQE